MGTSGVLNYVQNAIHPNYLCAAAIPTQFTVDHLCFPTNGNFKIVQKIIFPLTIMFYPGGKGPCIEYVATSIFTIEI